MTDFCLGAQTIARIAQQGDLVERGSVRPGLAAEAGSAVPSPERTCPSQQPETAIFPVKRAVCTAADGNPTFGRMP